MHAFAQRLDCRTYFIEHQEYGHDRPAGVFRGADEEQFALSRDIFRRLELTEEIAKEEVLREFGQSAQMDAKTNQVAGREPAQELRSFVQISRRVKGIPVWSSHCNMGLTAKREIGFLELHWPAIPEAVLREAQRLTFKVANGWKAPEVSAAVVESVAAGIVHTPAIGYFFDIHAAIRVIYRPVHANIGRKPMYHLDRHGDPVLLRRTSDLIGGAPQEPRKRSVEGTAY